MRHLHASARSQETSDDADPLHLHAHPDRRTRLPVLARVTIAESEGATARGCPRHALAALSGIIGARVDWADSKGLNEWERKALELSGERSKLSARWKRRPAGLVPGVLSICYFSGAEGLSRNLIISGQNCSAASALACSLPPRGAPLTMATLGISGGSGSQDNFMTPFMRAALH
jgi:hypothetical protein